MYLYETEFGEVFRPRPRTAPANPPPKSPQRPPPKEGKVVADGHERFCLPPDRGTVSCDLTLKVRFRRSFDEFLREVEGAYARWMERSTARALVKKLQKDLQQSHQEMSNSHALDNDPILLVVGLFYRKSNGSWLVNDSSFRQWRRLIDI
jgi:hypothetical protein